MGNRSRAGGGGGGLTLAAGNVVATTDAMRIIGDDLKTEMTTHLRGPEGNPRNADADQAVLTHTASVRRAMNGINRAHDGRPMRVQTDLTGGPVSKLVKTTITQGNTRTIIETFHGSRTTRTTFGFREGNGPLTYGGTLRRGQEEAIERRATNIYGANPKTSRAKARGKSKKGGK